MALLLGGVLPCAGSSAASQRDWLAKPCANLLEIGVHLTALWGSCPLHSMLIARGGVFKDSRHIGPHSFKGWKVVTQTTVGQIHFQII